jgi:antitoxin (DNA-binding transcriptional repressor) of toxin-antitoxin stability system
MRVNTTQFRKQLFQIVERALQGEHIEMGHKGRVLRLVPEDKPSKLARLIPRDTICGSLSDLDQAQLDLDNELRNAWEAKWTPKA